MTKFDKKKRMAHGNNQYNRDGAVNPKIQSGPTGQPLEELPDCPSRFDDDPDGQFEWNRAGSVLVNEKRLTIQDLGMLEGLCMAWSDMQRSERCIRKRGQLIEGKKNPVATMLVAARSAHIAYSSAFGLSPMARKKLDIKPYEEPKFNCFDD